MVVTSERQLSQGHVFIVRGDLTRLAADAVLVPTDKDLNLTSSWWGLFEEDHLRPSVAGWKSYTGPLSTGWADGAGRASSSRHWLFVGGRHDATPEWLGESVRAALRVVARDVEAGDRRVRPLVALPPAGTGDGGLQHRRGAVVEALLPVLRQATADLELDIALVLRDERDAAAVQARRSTAAYWESLPADLRSRADRLGRLAANGELSLFLGAGVSLPLGLPGWRTLVDDLRQQAQLRPTANGDDLPLAAQEAVTVLGTDALTTLLRQLVVEQCTVSHALLAGLQVGQVVTTNYDTAYEVAVQGLRSSSIPALKVLTQTKVEPPLPWLLKLHGDAATGRGVVLTQQQYADFLLTGNPLRGMVQTLLLTSHVLFVGYSLHDETFVISAGEVQAVLADAIESRGHLGTVVPVFEDEKLRKRCGDQLDYAPMPVPPEHAERGARLLEIFLDRMSWAAATARHDAWEYLLDPRYADVVVSEADREVGRLALRLLTDAGSLARTSEAWPVLTAALRRLGADVDS